MTTETEERIHLVRTRGVRKLDIGAGAKRDDGYETMDLSSAYSPDFQHDLTQFPWPFADEAFVEVRALHVLEHVERKHLIAVMNEAWRVLEIGGRFVVEVPVFPFWQAIADPTHVSFFLKQSFYYFDVAHEEYDEHRKLYGIKPWRIIVDETLRDAWGSILRVPLEKVGG